jgi:hypothetical protein
VHEAFFEPLGDGRYLAGAFTGGPWDPRMQHGGPVSALLARELTDVEPVTGQVLGRVTLELLRPVPIGPLRIEARVARPGKKVSLVDAVLAGDDDRELMLARAWRLQPTPLELTSTVHAPTMPPPEQLVPADRFAGDDVPGFMRGVEVRFARGHFSEPGPGAAWFRLRAPLVAGTPWRSTDPVFIAADCGNGISRMLDFTRYVFVNPDLTVNLSRNPDDEWVGLDAETTVTPGGITVASGRIQDARGILGRSIQTLYVDAR